MRSLAAGVLTSASGFERWVVCNNREVAAFALHQGAQVIWRGGGLNAAVQQAYDQLSQTGLNRVVVAHGDLASPGDLATEFAGEGTDPSAVLIAPDRHGDGTNVISIPAGLPFRFAYGPGSLQRHVEESNRCEAPVTVLQSTGLALDIDTPADLALYRDLQ